MCGTCNYIAGLVFESVVGAVCAKQPEFGCEQIRVEPDLCLAGSAHLASVSEVSFDSVLREEEVESIDAGKVPFPGRGHVVD